MAFGVGRYYRRLGFSHRYPRHPLAFVIPHVLTLSPLTVHAFVREVCRRVQWTRSHRQVCSPAFLVRQKPGLAPYHSADPGTFEAFLV